MAGILLPEAARALLESDAVAHVVTIDPGGMLFGTFGSGDNPEEHEDFFGAPMYWSHFDADTNRQLIAETVMPGSDYNARRRDELLAITEFCNQTEATALISTIRSCRSRLRSIC